MNLSPCSLLSVRLKSEVTAADNSIPMDVDSYLLSTLVAVPFPSASDMEPMSGPSTSYEPPDAVPGILMMNSFVPHPLRLWFPQFLHCLFVLSKNLTPRKLHLKRRLDIMSNLRSEQKWYIDRVRNLKGLINWQRMSKINYLNQKIKRKTASLSVKEATITKLWRQLQEAKGKKEVRGSSAIMDDLNLKQLQRTHK